MVKNNFLLTVSDSHLIGKSNTEINDTFGTVPQCLPYLVLPVLNGCDPEGGLVGEHETAGCEPLVPCIQNGVQHGLVEEAVAHPLGDDDVHLRGKN